ncbi:hypothetical protein [Streptomyces sp. NPDC056634]|uniref:hypothetical protein n=1 Tax=Streptomyces sp. NPDC056634 TaxID=3345885 RepID=UPI003698A789
METALYFPYMRPPRTSWFTKVLLYWDSAATIVPNQYIANLGPDTTDLVNQNLLHPIDPGFAFDDMPYDFDSKFIEFLGKDAASQIGRRAKNNGRQSTRDWTSIHGGKTSPRLFEQLQYMGLARQANPDPDWWELETRTAKLYMEWLAAGICLLSDGLIAVTDDAKSITNPYATAETSEERLRALRFAAITDALPAPSCPVPASELRSFKDKHGEKLGELRTFLNGKLADLTKEPDEYLRSVKSAEIHRDIKDSVAELSSAMTAKNWPISLWGIGGITLPALTQAPGIAQHTDSPLILSLISLAGLVGVVKQGYEMREWRNKPKYDGRNPLVYAALAGKL